MFSFYLFILLAVVLSMDAFAAGLSYGIEKVYVPLFSLLIIAFVSGGMLTLSMIAGDFIIGLIPIKLAKILSFSILFLLSLYKFYDAFPQLHPKGKKTWTGTIPQKINTEDKTVLSGREAVLLSLALSLDNISAGLSTGTIPLPYIILLLLTTAIHFAAVRLGLLAGNLLSEKKSCRLAWLGAAILMFLSFCRLL